MEYRKLCSFLKEKTIKVDIEEHGYSESYSTSDTTSATDTAPVWLDDKSVNEIIFCDEFLSEHRIICINNQFIGFDGVIEDIYIEKLIYEKLKPYIQKGVAGKVKQLCQALKLDAHSEEIVPDINEIHLLNGTLNAETSEFTYEKKFCFGRINNSYNPNAASPEKFLSFLSELLIPEDILTLQEWFGYLLRSIQRKSHERCDIQVQALRRCQSCLYRYRQA